MSEVVFEGTRHPLDVEPTFVQVGVHHTPLFPLNNPVRCVELRE